MVFLVHNQADKSAWMWEMGNSNCTSWIPAASLDQLWSQFKCALQPLKAKRTMKVEASEGNKRRFIQTESCWIRLMPAKDSIPSVLRGPQKETHYARDLLKAKAMERHWRAADVIGCICFWQITASLHMGLIFLHKWAMDNASRLSHADTGMHRCGGHVGTWCVL